MAGVTLDPFRDRYAARTHGMTTSEIRALFSVANRPEVVSLAGGSPFTAALPLDAVGAMLGELVADRGPQALNYGPGQGDPRLREQICEVMALEGIHASAEDVVVTVGSQQALDLVSRVFLDPGDVVLAEAPSYVGALGTFAAAQADVVHIAMDNDGLVPEALSAALAQCASQGKRVKFLYTVPNFHNPAGVSLSTPRRAQILEIAEAADLLVLEDNPYGLLGFDADPVPALRSRTEDGVIYLGSFSKTFAPGFRIGWVLAPHATREKLVLASEAQVLCPPSFSQFAVSRYLETQPWQEQVKVFRELYRERRDALLEAMAQHFPAGCSWTRPDGGFYSWVTLPPGVHSKVMQPRALAARVAYVPGTGFYADHQGGEFMRLSYCFPPPERIREGVRRLAAVIEEELELLETFGPGSGSGTPGRFGAEAAPTDLA
ncbi:MAG TPA: PLP-dependent aminotransferase family protein [Mycobacteriales bacterium]|jgi:DNA-binding transcriptional MocR family regulator|nr:PLP-dependent aminotransferase family protein [Mycobacteriales bacterium]